MNVSYWEQSSFLNQYSTIIIGSGIVGLSAALHLKKLEPQENIAILERGTLPSGASTKNAGFACFGSISELLDDLKTNDENLVFSLVEKRWKGLQKLRTYLGDHQLDFQPLGGFDLFRTKEESNYQNCVDKMMYLNNLLKEIVGNQVFIAIEKPNETFGFDNISGIIKNNYEGQIDTGRMMVGLINRCKYEGIDILTGTTVENIEDANNYVNIKTSDNLIFKCEKTIVATNGFAKTLLPYEDVQPARAQILITEPIENLKFKGSFHYDKGFYYFRNINNRILLGGGRNIDFNGENTSEIQTTENIQNALEQILRQVILPKQKYRIESRWAGIMGIGNSKTPIIKKISKNVSCAIRLGGMGVALGMQAGEEAVDSLVKS